MTNENNGPSSIENPGAGDDQGKAERAPSTSGIENPDAASAEIEALTSEADQQAVYAEAGVSDDLLALRDSVEATLLAASGEIDVQASAAMSQGIVGVGIGLPDPDSMAVGSGGRVLRR